MRWNRRARQWLGGALLCVLLALGAAGAMALEPTTPLGSYGRQTWVMENGMPQNTVHALAQTRDGFLWIGTEVGLVRFDGHSFVVLDEHSQPKLPNGDIRCLLATDDGALWIGTGDGLARLKDGAVRVYTEKDGLPGNVIRSLVESRNGILWASTGYGLARFEEDRFVSTNVAGITAGAASTVTGDGQGTVWITNSSSAARYEERWSAARRPSSGNRIFP